MNKCFVIVCLTSDNYSYKSICSTREIAIRELNKLKAEVEPYFTFVKDLEDEFEMKCLSLVITYRIVEMDLLNE